MFKYIKSGLRSTLNQPFSVLVLFLYRFGWGVALYKLVQSYILPILHRYPNVEGLETQTNLFLAEAQFVLFKTDISHSVLWLLAALLAIRMVLTPLLNAGVLFSLSNPHYNAGYRFVRGIKELWKSYTLLYTGQTLLTLLPMWWMLPRLKTAFLSARTYPEMASELLPLLALLLGYSFVVRLVFLYLQLGRATSHTAARSLGIAFKSLPVMLGVAALLLLAASLCSLAVLGSTIVWAGFWMLVLYQAYRFIQTLFTVWGIASQQEIYTARAER
ncbi:MAG: hypothetical protein K0Q90_81 [Paenibacillaceae bacterium]|nr:hypothetical protein [Paenibacillaceae bacterium]